jgi:dTDP-4-amino-4,6-dideoxygalactose transaminase
MIPVSTVRLGEDVERQVLDVLRSGQLAQGPVVARLEELMASIAGTAHAVAVSNGTVSLMAALQALGVGPGDEVITSPFTFVATINAILHVGATVRFADIDPDDFLVRADAVEALVNERTRAIMPVHLYGQMADMDAIARTADRRQLAIIEDAAQAHGARCGERRAGSYGVGSFSLYATKNVTTGEGGVVTTDDASIADTIRVLRNQGMRARYDYVLPGYNFRLTDLQAAVGVPQLERLEDINATRRSNAARLDEGLAGLQAVRTPVVRDGRRHVFHQYTVRILDDAPVTRDEVVDRLAQRGVGSGVYYPRVAFDYDCFRDHPRVVDDDVATARSTASQVLSLPVHPYLTDDELDQVIEAVRVVVS